MANTFRQEGKMVPFTAGSALSSGDVVDLAGQGLGIVQNDVASAATGVAALCGVHELAKTAGAAWTQGEELYWDASAESVTVSPGATNANKRIGVAFAAAASGATTGLVALNAPRLAGTGYGEVHIQPQEWRVHDAFQTNSPGSAGTDDLGVIAGAFGTKAPTLQGVDFGGTTTTGYARTVKQLPDDYAPGEPVTIHVTGGMLTTVSDGTATADVEVRKLAADGTPGSDICATAAQSINSLTKATVSFTITPTGLVPGDRLDIRVAIIGSDTGNAGVMTPEISDVVLAYAKR